MHGTPGHYSHLRFMKAPCKEMCERTRRNVRRRPRRSSQTCWRHREGLWATARSYPGHRARPRPRLWPPRSHRSQRLCGKRGSATTKRAGGRPAAARAAASASQRALRPLLGSRRPPWRRPIGRPVRIGEGPCQYVHRGRCEGGLPRVRAAATHLSTPRRVGARR